MKPIKQKEPKLITLIFTAFSGISLGLLLGIFLLIKEPPSTVSKIPTPEEKATVGNYKAWQVSGKVGAAESPNYRTAISRIQRRTLGPVSLSEEEINYFFAQFKNGEKPAEGANQSSSLDGLNFYLEGDQMIASFRLVIDPKGDRFEMLVQANVDFENSDAGPKLVIKSMKVNSLPLPNVGNMLAGMVASKLQEAELPEDLVKMWENVKKIELESGKLIVEVGFRQAAS